MIIKRRKNDAVVSGLQKLIICFPVFRTPSLRLVCTGDCQGETYIRILFLQEYDPESRNSIKSERTAAEKPSVSGFIGFGNTLVHFHPDGREIFMSQESVACEERGLRNAFFRKIRRIHRINPFSAQQGKPRSEPVRCRTDAYVFSLPFAFPAVSFFE